MANTMTNGLTAENFARAATSSRAYDRPVGKKTAFSSPGWLTRLADALMESRLRKAERELSRFRHALPDGLDLRANLSANSLPFSR